jgi:hypothetical protein
MVTADIVVETRRKGATENHECTAGDVHA